MKIENAPIEMSYNAAACNPLFYQALSSHNIKVVAPASGCSFDLIDKLSALPNLNIDIHAAIVNQDNVFHSSCDLERFKQLKSALYSPAENTIIWTLRGGYGSARLIDMMSQLPPPKQEKIFIGYSDNTALHLFLSQQWNWKTIHASGLTQILDAAQDPQNYLKIAEIIAQSVSSQTMKNLRPMNAEAKQSNIISGQLTGGNLTLVENSIGTSWQIQTCGKILFLEEVSEKGYRIDRSLNHLRQANLFTDVKAILFGEFISKPKDDSIHFALARFAEDVHIPVYKTNQFGHGKKNYPLVYNAKAEIRSTLNQNYSLEMATLFE